MFSLYLFRKSEQVIELNCIFNLSIMIINYGIIGIFYENVHLLQEEENESESYFGFH